MSSDAVLEELRRLSQQLLDSRKAEPALEDEDSLEELQRLSEALRQGQAITGAEPSLPAAPPSPSPSTAVAVSQAPAARGAPFPDLTERRRGAAASFLRRTGDFLKGGLGNVLVPGTGARGVDATLEALEWYQRNVTEPTLAAASVFKLPNPGIPGFAKRGGFSFDPEQFPGQPDFRGRYRENVPLGGRILGEMVLDPANLIPGIGFTRFPRGIRRGVTRGVEAVTPVERAVVEGAVELPEEVAAPILKEGAAPAALPEAAAQAAPPASGIPPRVPPDQDPVIQKALQVIKGVKRVSKSEQAAMFAAERKARFARGMAASEGLPIEQGFKRMLAAQAGEFPRPDIAPIVGQFSEDEVSHLFRRIEVPGVLRPGWDQTDAAKALADLLHPSTAKIPMPRDLALLERAFGAKFARELYNKKRTASQAVWDEFIAAWNLPRSIKASLDLSATARQGGILAPGNIKIWKDSVLAELKAYRSEKYAAQAWNDIYFHPNFERLTNAGLSLTERGATAPLLAREEAFMSRWASRIPGIRASERAYVTMLNKLRFDVANKMLGELEAKGLTAGELDRQMSGVADFVNWTTGRGPVLPGGRLAEGVQAVLNGTMFSPRFMTSRFAVLTLPVTAYQNPAIRTKLAGDLVKWVGVTAMAVGLAKGAGARVELDPRSSEWGKIVVGHTRYDPWAGMQQTARLIAGLYHAQSMSSLGQVYSTDDEELISKRKRLKSERLEAVAKGETLEKMSPEEFAQSGRFLPARAHLLKRYFRNKLQPSAAEALDQLTGQDWLGDEVKPSTAISKDPRRNLFIKNVIPILVEDIMEAIYAGENPATIAPAAAASSVGLGASTYATQADVGREEFPGLTLEELRAKPEATQKQWAREARRRRGIKDTESLVTAGR